MARRLFLWFLYGYYVLLKKTLRFEIAGIDKLKSEIEAGASPVFCAAHNDLLLCVLSYDGSPATLIASQSKDGEMIASILERRGFSVVRGSSSRGSVQALRELNVSASNGYALGITFDGPRGPPLIPKRGVAQCAWASNGSAFFAYAELLPSKIWGRPLYVRLNSWDRFLLPLPGARFKMHFIKIEVDANKAENPELWRKMFLQNLQVEAQKAHGALYLGWTRIKNKE